MKKTFTVLVTLAILGGTLVAFKAPSDPAAAIVDQQAGLYIFHKSKPAGESKYLGTVKCGGVVPAKDFETILGILIKRAKQDFPEGNALIVHEWDADVIKLGE